MLIHWQLLLSILVQAVVYRYFMLGAAKVRLLGAASLTKARNEVIQPT